VKLIPYNQGEANRLGSFFLDELEQTHFNEASAAYSRFYFAVVDLVQSLPLVLHNLPKIADLVLEYLEHPDCTFEIVKILPSLIRDARQDIFEIFCEKLLPSLVAKIDMRQLEELEAIYATLAFSIKFLFKSIRGNLKVFYQVFQMQLFHRRNKNLRRFSTQAFSYIFKKLARKEVATAIGVLLAPLSEEKDEKSPGDSDAQVNHVAALLFEIVKGTRDSFDAKAGAIVPEVVRTTLENIGKVRLQHCFLAFFELLLTEQQ
jgi:hypothetical protein